LTGFGEEMHPSGNQPVGIDLVIGKPVTGVDLRRAIQKVFASEMSAVA
jgi:hypothetical protein